MVDQLFSSLAVKKKTGKRMLFDFLSHKNYEWINIFLHAAKKY